MVTRDYKSISEIISAIENNSEELTRAFSIKIIENDLYVENKYVLRAFEGSDLLKLLQYASRKHYNTSSIAADLGIEAEIILFR